MFVITRVEPLLKPLHSPFPQDNNERYRDMEMHAMATHTIPTRDDPNSGAKGTMTASTTTTAAATTRTETTIDVSKGRNVSGRGWKTQPQKRASSLIKTAFNNQSTSWAKKVAERTNRREAAALQSELREQKRQSAIQKKARRLENETRRAENEFRAVQKSVQSLNHSKIGVTLKAMSKKQLRQVKKTRMNQKTGVVEYVSAYAK